MKGQFSSILFLAVTFESVYERHVTCHTSIMYIFYCGLFVGLTEKQSSNTRISIILNMQYLHNAVLVNCMNGKLLTCLIIYSFLSQNTSIHYKILLFFFWNSWTIHFSVQKPLKGWHHAKMCRCLFVSGNFCYTFFFWVRV